MLLGPQLGAGALGAMDELSPELRQRLASAGTVGRDEAALDSSAFTKGVGEAAEANGQRIRVVGLVQGTKGVTAPYVGLLLRDCRQLLALRRANRLRARPLRDPEQAPGVVEKLRQYHDMSAFTQPGTVYSPVRTGCSRPAAARAMAFHQRCSACWWGGDHQPILVRPTGGGRCASSPCCAPWAFRAWRIAGVVVTQAFWIWRGWEWGWPCGVLCRPGRRRAGSTCKSAGTVDPGLRAAVTPGDGATVGPGALRSLTWSSPRPCCVETN